MEEKLKILSSILFKKNIDTRIETYLINSKKIKNEITFQYTSRNLKVANHIEFIESFDLNELIVFFFELSDEKNIVYKNIYLIENKNVINLVFYDFESDKYLIEEINEELKRTKIEDKNQIKEESITQYKNIYNYNELKIKKRIKRLLEKKEDNHIKEIKFLF